MASLAHMGFALIFKRWKPEIYLGWFVFYSYLIDIIFMIFWAVGLEKISDPSTTNPYSHGMFMGLIWSILAGLVIYKKDKQINTSVLIGLLVFSHWIIDFISHPMTAVFPEDTKLSVFFEGSAQVGLGLWGTELGIFFGEYVFSLIGVILYIQYRFKAKKEKSV